MESTASTKSIIYIDNIPPGGVIMWTKSEIPKGWALCDGTDGRPDLRDKFVRAARTEKELKTLGGQDQIQLGLEHLPKHSHGVTDPGHGHTLTLPYENPKKTPKGKGSSTDNDSTVHSPSPNKIGIISKSKTGITINDTGEEKTCPIDNRPSFYSLYFIIKLES